MMGLIKKFWRVIKINNYVIGRKKISCDNLEHSDVTQASAHPTWKSHRFSNEDLFQCQWKPGVTTSPLNGDLSCRYH